MTTFGLAPLSSIIDTRFVEATEASVLQQLLTAELVDIGDVQITTVNLSGAGDGYTFVTEINVSSNPIGRAYESQLMLFGCYSASSAEELARARTAVVAAMLATTPPEQGDILELVDSQLVGASKGTRFMGLLIGVWFAPD